MNLTSILWRLVTVTAVLALLGLGAAMPAASQSPLQCVMNGFVVDPQQKGVSDATVRLALENGQTFVVASNVAGFYSLEFPLPTAPLHGILYAQRFQDSSLLMTGAIDFRNCRQERNIFVNSSRAVPPGPEVPPGPGFPPAYPGPSDAPPDVLSDVLVYVDPRSLGLGAVIPGRQVRLPLCISNLGRTSQPISVDQVTWKAGFRSDQIQISALLPTTSPFEIVNSAIDNNGSNNQGSITYSGSSNTAVILPRWPDCIPLATLDINIDPALQAGDTAWVMSTNGTTARRPPTLGPVPRMTTYLEVMNPRVFLPFIARGR